MVNTKLKKSLLSKFLSTLNGVTNVESLTSLLLDQCDGYSPQIAEGIIKETLVKYITKYNDTDQTSLINMGYIVRFVLSDDDITPISNVEFDALSLVYDNVVFNGHRANLMQRLIDNEVRDYYLIKNKILNRISLHTIGMPIKGISDSVSSDWVSNKLNLHITNQNELMAYDIIVSITLSMEMLILRRYK